jgi:conjugative transposon TraM protein
MENQNSRKGKALLFLPLLIIPFLTLAFWALGGGKGEIKQQAIHEGLNLQLPSAHTKDLKGETKLSFYETAEKDSAKLREEMKNDPLFQQSFYEDTVIDSETFTYEPELDKSKKYSDPMERKVYEKLHDLNVQLHSDDLKKSTDVAPQNEDVSYRQPGIDRLENLMQNMNRDSATDPELTQLNSMMEKILDIQHPDRVRDQAHSDESQKAFFRIAKVGSHASVSLLDTMEEEDSGIGFYGLEDKNLAEENNAVEAVIHQNQTIFSGSIIKMRLLNDIYIHDVLIGEGSFIYGKCSINGERLQIEIKSIKSGSSIYPVNLEVYDMDGLAGVYIPGAITRDAAKQSYENSLQSVDIGSYDPSVKGKITSAGIGAAKTLLTKKARKVKVFVKAGYRILIRQKNITNTSN